MTDKQMEEKKKEFMEKFVDIEFGEYDQGLILGKEEVEEMWQWIFRLCQDCAEWGYYKYARDMGLIKDILKQD